MRTANQCLDKALELEFRAMLCAGAVAGEDFLSMARTWRRMACLAQIQDLYDLEPVGRA